MSDAFARKVADALVASVDARALEKRLRALTEPGEASRNPTDVAPGPTAGAAKLQHKIGLADILDDSILAAQRGDSAFPLRLLFGELVARAGDDDDAFALASALNVYFRVAMDEETKVRFALEVSRVYYRFAARFLDDKLRGKLSPLVAQLMSTELSRLTLEAVDHDTVFDSAVHERTRSSNESRAAIKHPSSFMCRVAATNQPRFKASVTT